MTCGAVNALDTMAAAMCLRTPRTGMRSSPPGTVGEVAVRDPFPDWAERACVSAVAARCTSSRVIEPSGPLPASAARLMPRSLASLRTGGLASVGLDCARTAATPGSAARGSVARGSVASSGASTGTSGAVGTSAVSGRPAAVLRARRVVDKVLTP